MTTTTNPRLTNRHGLPATIVAAIENDPYDAGDSDATITTLVDSPRIGALKRRHRDDIVEDAGDNLFRLFGKGIHAVLEQAGEAFSITEERLYADVGGWRISGQFDNLTLEEDAELQEGREGWTLWDWKATSVYAVKDLKPQWEAQLNCYAWLLRQHGFNVTSLYIGALLRDWSLPRSKREKDYPPIGWKTLPMRLWPETGQLAYLEERVALHRAVRLDLPQCSAEDRWAKPDSWAVMKGSNKRAVKVFSDEAVAREFQPDPDGATYRVEFRPGVSTRCDGYCAVLDFCDQGQVLVAATKGDES